MSHVVVYLLLGLVIALGALVQSAVGFGVAVVAAPVIVVVRPDLMPASLLVTSLALPVWELVAGGRDIDWRLFGSATAGRLALLPVGVWLVTVSSADTIAVIVGVMVLVAVLASVTPLEVRAAPVPALLAGMLAGISGTAASIGGPFFGLVLQHEQPARLRSTLAAFFVVGASSALIGLAVAGHVNPAQVLAGLGWIPFVALGAACAYPLRSRFDRNLLRTAVLWVAALAGVSVLIRAAVG